MLRVQRDLAPLIQASIWSFIIEKEMLRKQRIALLDRHGIIPTKSELFINLCKIIRGGE